MENIIEWIKWLYESIIEGIKGLLLWLLGPLWDLITTAFHWIIDKIFGFVEFVFGLIDFNESIFDTALSWASIPDQAIYILNQMQISTCITIIVTSLTIRLLLNLIPSWATRV